MNYTVAFPTKYRYDVLNGVGVAARVGELIDQVCASAGYVLLKDERVLADAIHVYVADSETATILNFINSLKGTISYNLQIEFPAVKAVYRGKQMFDTKYMFAAEEKTDEEVDTYIASLPNFG